MNTLKINYIWTKYIFKKSLPSNRSYFALLVYGQHTLTRTCDPQGQLCHICVTFFLGFTCVGPNKEQGSLQITDDHWQVLFSFSVRLFYTLLHARRRARRPSFPLKSWHLRRQSLAMGISPFSGFITGRKFQNRRYSRPALWSTTDRCSCTCMWHPWHVWRVSHVSRLTCVWHVGLNWIRLIFAVAPWQYQAYLR